MMAPVNCTGAIMAYLPPSLQAKANYLLLKNNSYVKSLRTFAE
jgi:hypothetical protein